MRKFWESKKWLAFGAGVVISIVTYILNKQYGLGIETNAVLSILGLSSLYILVQGNIDKKKELGAAAKNFWESNKAIAVLVGDCIPLMVATVNQKWGLGIDPGVIIGFIGLDAVYLLRQGGVDLKDPNTH